MTSNRPTIQPAKLLSSRSHQIPGKLLVTEFFFQVPLDHSNHQGEQIRIFCRSARKFDKPTVPKPTSDEDQLPWFVYIPGGPGFGCPPPQNLMEFTNTVLARGYQFLAFDHRGMGLSTPATAASITAKGSPGQQAEYLKHFRAGNAVKDLEAIRKCLTADYPEEKKKWTIMGSSYGGFVCLNYLSFHPEGLREVFPVAGMAPVTQSTPDLPIEKLFKKVMGRNQNYYAKYPEDKVNVCKILELLDREESRLPCGDVLTPARFLEMGILFGFHGGLDAVHDVVLRAANDMDIFGYLTRPTLSAIEGSSSFNDQPLYAVMHGSIYVQGQASDWVFDRVMKKYPEFETGQQATREDGPLFTGEMVFRRAFENYGELKTLLPVAELLEKKTDWPDLYDLNQLRKNEVPVYAAIYVEDMYVDLDYSLETASIVKGCKTFITNTLYHDAIRSKNEEVLKALFALRDDTID
ncbi:proline iminopeptidase [Exophiala viscosa]|uniref:proline iminopeptidase n=1 Tax=Exophiala viscosa TaxID=2486360 RepID=UPI0021964F44|nr:proline iminopeptidase [Exophiala viscosa]